MRLFYILLILGHTCLGQRDYFFIKGRVTDDENPETRIYAIKVELKIKDSLVLVAECDSSGRYAFKLNHNFPPGTRAVVWAYQDWSLLKELFPPPPDCPYVRTPNQYLGSDSRVINFRENLTDFVADFPMKKILTCGELPTITFKKNTLTLIPYHNYDPDTAIYCLKHILLHNPTVEIEIVGHAWKERSKKELSIKRAQFVRHRLITYGIDSLRMTIAGKGDTEALHNKKAIKRTHSDKERSDMEASNRGVWLRVLSFDYDPKGQIKNSSRKDSDKKD